MLKENNLVSLLDYVYKKSKRKILLHETINNEQIIYDMKTSENKLRKKDNQVINPVDWRLMPKEIIVLSQRLPR